MLRALLTDSEGRITLVLGLGRGNFKRLHADEPLVLDLRDVDGTGQFDYAGKIDRVVVFDDSTPEKHEAFMRMIQGLPFG